MVDHGLSQEVAQFLFNEARLLDRWDLDTWLDLFEPDARYTVPATDVGDPGNTVALPLIDDDRRRLGARVTRLKSTHAHAEYPRSRTRRLITNVTAEVSQDDVTVQANFAVYRCRHEHVDLYIGRYEHQLVKLSGGYRFRHRQAILDLETLEIAGGKVSIIL